MLRRSALLGMLSLVLTAGCAVPRPSPEYTADVERATNRRDLAAKSLTEARRKRELARLDAEIADLEQEIARLQEELRKAEADLQALNDRSRAASGSTSASGDQTVHTGPRGGKYVITPSGKKRYIKK